MVLATLSLKESVTLRLEMKVQKIKARHVPFLDHGVSCECYALILEHQGTVLLKNSHNSNINSLPEFKRHLLRVQDGETMHFL